MISIITPALIKGDLEYAWLHECIASVDGQAGDWEHIIVNDHSPMDLSGLQAQWPGVRWLDAEGQGVSAARNQAAEAAQGDLLLPLDADDKLGPDALSTFLTAWDSRGDANIIYSDVIMFGEDYAQVYLAAEYSFKILLTATFMTVGSLHRKADWERVGGWRLDMTKGLEDWEYWIALGELGVCGKRVAEPLYWYRRHPRGRLQWLKGNHELWNKAYATMRELHIDSYNGRYPMGCCGGRASKGARRPGRPMKATAQPPKGGEMLLVYNGPRKGDFRVVGGITRTAYYVPGKGGIVEFAGTGRQGVNPADLPWFRSVNQGRDFRVVKRPKAATAPVPAPAPKPDPVVVKPEAWEPEIMEPKPVPVPDIQAMTVAEIRAMDIEPDTALDLIMQEHAGKQRKMVLVHLDKVAVVHPDVSG